VTTSAAPRARDRKATIVAAAAELFAARGFAGTAIDEIGARVGITGPAIYRHFRGKDALLAAVVMDTVDAFAVSGAAVAAGHERLVEDAVAVALDGPARLVTYVRERHRLAGDARDALARGERRLYRPWRDAIRAANPGLAPGEVAVRQRAVLTAMSAVGARPQSVPRPRLERLLVESMVAVLSVPPVPAPVSVLAPTPARGSAPRPPGPPARWSVPPSRRDRILAEALHLFRERGYHGVGMDEIGRAAGVSGPTIYFHYDSKGDLLADAFDRAGARVAAAVHDSVAGAASASDALDRLAASYLEIAAASGDLILVTSREAAALAESDRPRLARRRGEVLGTWAAVVRELRPDLDEGAVRAVVAGVHALMNQTAYALGDAREGVPLVRAWCLGRPAWMLTSV
jgi:AcrR family transcriptional regulator